MVSESIARDKIGVTRESVSVLGKHMSPCSRETMKRHLTDLFSGFTRRDGHLCCRQSAVTLRANSVGFEEKLGEKRLHSCRPGRDDLNVSQLVAAISVTRQFKSYNDRG